MKITRGEFRGLVALALLLAVVMAVMVWCQWHAVARAEAASSPAVESALVTEAKSRAVVAADSVAAGGKRKSKVSTKRGKTNKRTVHDAASPLDDVNS